MNNTVIRDNLCYYGYYSYIIRLTTDIHEKDCNNLGTNFLSKSFILWWTLSWSIKVKKEITIYIIKLPKKLLFLRVQNKNILVLSLLD
jgi:hypothetical protein